MPTAAEIEAAKTPRGGWTKAQLAAWGVPWPPPKGWRAALVEPVAVYLVSASDDCLACDFTVPRLVSMLHAGRYVLCPSHAQQAVAVGDRLTGGGLRLATYAELDEAAEVLADTLAARDVVEARRIMDEVAREEGIPPLYSRHDH